MAIDTPTTEMDNDLVARLRRHQASTVDDLFAINGTPHLAVLEKHTSYLTPLLEEFILAAPFFTDRDGGRRRQL